MAPLKDSSRLAARAYYYTSRYSDEYYRNRIIGIVIGICVFVILLIFAIVYHSRKVKARRAAIGQLPYGPGGAMHGQTPTPHSTAPPPYTGPAGQEPTWNGTQWQGPNNEDGTPGPCWNGVQWCVAPGPVWNGAQWVQGGPVNGVNVPMSENGRVWNGTRWVGPQDNFAAGQETGVVDWHKRDLEGQTSGVTTPAPVYAMNEEDRRDTLRSTNGVNADGGLGHAATQSMDFGAVGSAPATNAAPEMKEEKPKGWKKWLK